MLLRLVVIVGASLGSACVVSGYGSTNPPPRGGYGAPMIATAPPPPREEHVPTTPGYVFITGRWTWQNGNWVWTAGHWERERPGYAWNQGRWQPQGGGWIWIEGTWSVASGPLVRPPPAGAPPSEPPTVRPQPMTNPNAIGMLALGEGYSCSLSVGGKIRCWGHNHHGALGVGSTARKADGFVTGIEGEVRAIAAGGFQTCALTATGHVWCWGSNIEGQIGNGSVAPSERPVLKPVRVSGIDNVQSLHLGDKTSCAVTRDRKLYCWGENHLKQIDDSSNKQITRPTQVRGASQVELVAVGNYHVCWVSGGRAQCRGQVETLNPAVANLTNITSISAGYGHSCAIHDGGKVSCWGNDYHGVLGQGNQCPNRDGACTSAMRAPAIVPGIGPDPVEIACNTYFTCVRHASGGVTCFGSNQGGSFSDKLPKDPWQKATVIEGAIADSLYVGGIHLCTLRNGAQWCRGNDSEGAVNGVR